MLDAIPAPTLEVSPPGGLRDYQLTDLGRIQAALEQHRRVCYVLPTGGGKTKIFSVIAADTAIVAGERAIILGHRQEIVDQISLALTSLGMAHGLIRPDAPMTDHAVQVAMVQTLARRLDAVAEPRLVIIDESHHAVASTWVRIAAAWPTARVLGVTATPERLDGRGLRDAFDVMVEGPDTASLIAQGYLAPIRYLAPDSRIDLSRVRTTAGDYNVGDLADVMDRDTVTGNVIAHYLRHLGGRTAIAFCVTVAHAEHVARQFRDAGIPAASIDGSMSSAERRDVVARLRCGDIRVLTSCEVISEGFDAPAVGGCILLRPTQSLALFRQQIGRCLRPKTDGSEAVVLDHVGNVWRHGLPTSPHAWSLDSTRRAPAERQQASGRLRRCKACDMVFAAGVRGDYCGVDACLFAPPAFIERSGELQEMPPASPQTPLWAAVYGWSGRVHQKLGTPPCFRLDYRTSEGWVSAFLSFSHPNSGARWHAGRAWRALAKHPYLEPPLSATDALTRFEEGELRRPVRVQLRRDGTWWRIENYQFAAEAAEAIA